MCDVLSGGSRDVCQSVTGGEGSKLAKNSVTYFMDGPIGKFPIMKIIFVNVADYFLKHCRQARRETGRGPGGNK